MDCGDLGMWRCEDMKMKRCGLWRFGGVEGQRLRGVRLWRCKDIKTKRCGLRRFEGVEGQRLRGVRV